MFSAVPFRGATKSFASASRSAGLTLTTRRTTSLCVPSRKSGTCCPYPPPRSRRPTGTAARKSRRPLVEVRQQQRPAPLGSHTPRGWPWSQPPAARKVLLPVPRPEDPRPPFSYRVPRAWTLTHRPRSFIELPPGDCPGDATVRCWTHPGPDDDRVAVSRLGFDRVDGLFGAVVNDQGFSGQPGDIEHPAVRAAGRPGRVSPARCPAEAMPTPAHTVQPRR